MPYRVNTTPRQLKGKGIPQKFMNVFINSFNAKLKETGDEGKAFVYAYGSMNKALHNAGYRKGKDGKWSKAHEAQEVQLSYNESMGRRVVLEEGASLETALREGLTFTGIALIDNAVSQLGTGYERFYSQEYNDVCMKNTKRFEGLGHVVTMYNRHGSAQDSMFAASTENPIGKVSNFRRKEDAILYDAFISPTEKGKEVIQLLFDVVMGETSVRQTEVKSLLHRLNTEQDGDGEGEDYGYLEEMLTGRIAGIDLCDHAGITGAGIVRILDEAMSFDHYEQVEEVDVEINWEELTIEELLEHRKDIVDAHLATQLEVLTTQRAAVEAELARVKTELESAQAAAIAQPVRIAELELKLAIEQAAQIGVGKEIAKVLHERVTDVEQLPNAAKAAREEAIARVLASGAPGAGNARGASRPPEPPDADPNANDADESALSEEQHEMLRMITGPSTSHR